MGLPFSASIIIADFLQRNAISIAYSERILSVFNGPNAQQRAVGESSLGLVHRAQDVARPEAGFGNPANDWPPMIQGSSIF
jgi:hypothetical protein